MIRNRRTWLAVAFIPCVLASRMASAGDEPPSWAVSGYIQGDVVLDDESSIDELHPDTGEPLNEDRVLVRRARLRLDLERGVASAVLEVDANTVRGPVLRPILAEASFRGPWGGDLPSLQGTVGLMRIPFGHEVRTPVRERLFFEPATFARALFPGDHDVGVRLRGRWRWLTYELAAMNGEPVGESGFPGQDPNSSFDYLGRVGVDAQLGGGLLLWGGFSGLEGTGFHPGLPGTKDRLTWQDSNEDGVVQLPELQSIAGVAPTPSENFERSALGVDGGARWDHPCAGTFVLYGELVWASNLDRGLLPADPVSASRDLRERGWALAARYDSPRGPTAGVRYDRYDADADAAEQQGLMRVPVDSAVSTLSLVAGWGWKHGRVLMQADFEDNSLGRDESGRPTTMANDRVTLRGEVRY